MPEPTDRGAEPTKHRLLCIGLPRETVGRKVASNARLTSMVEQKWYGGRVCYESVGVGCGPVWRGRRRASARSSSSSPRPMGRCSALTSSKGGRLGGASHQYETFYTGSVILPTDVGTFRIFEPKYLDMFADLEVGDVFAHSTHERAAPDTIKRGVFEQDGLKVGIMGQGITGERPSPPPSRYPHAPSLLRCRSLLLTCGHAFLSAHTDQKKKPATATQSARC